MKNRHNDGFSLIETLIAIVVLGIVVVPVCTSLVLSVRINNKTEELLQAQLAVSSAVETLMAEGISADKIKSGVASDHPNYPDTDSETYTDVTVEEVYPGVGIHVEAPSPDGTPVYYNVTVVSTADNSVSVTTRIRAVPSVNTGTPGEEGNT